jgi:hypothetical protein
VEKHRTKNIIATAEHHDIFSGHNFVRKTKEGASELGTSTRNDKNDICTLYDM